MADTDVLIKDLPLTETVNDSDDLVTEDSSPTTHRIKASVVKNYINAEQNEELDGMKADLDNVNSNIGSLSSKVDDATTTVSSMQTNLNSMDGRVQANADGISELNSALANLLSTQTITVDNISIDASGYLNSTVSCSRSGYTAVGIVGVRCENASTDGVGVTRVFVNRFYLSNATTITYRVTNYYSTDAKIAITFTVLYTPS